MNTNNLSGKFIIQNSMRDAAIDPMHADLPIRVELLDLARHAVIVYGRYTALNPGTGSVEVSTPRSQKMDPAGKIGGTSYGVGR